jgi:hypothetical protein
MPKYRIDGEIYEAATPEEAYRQHAKKISPGMISGVAQQFTQGISRRTHTSLPRQPGSGP